MLLGLPFVNFLFLGGGFGNAIFRILFAKSEASGGGWSIVVAYDIFVVVGKDCDDCRCVDNGRGAKACILAMLTTRKAVVIKDFMLAMRVMRWMEAEEFVSR